MQARTIVAATLALLTLAVPLQAQTESEVRGAILQGANLGDRITVTLRDGARMSGRLVAARDALVVEHASEQRTFNFTDIQRVTRRKNGILLGAIIGTTAGAALGLPVRRLFNNEGQNGDRVLWTFVAAGAGIGIGLDALMASERTIYRHPSSRSAFAIAPTKAGVTARYSVNW